MFSTLRNRFGIPGVISVIALVFAMIGGAYAASNSGDGKGATASAKKKAAKGPRGPRGFKGATGAAGPAGPAGANGAKGDAGAAGANGSPGAKGDKGATGTNGVSVTSANEPPGPNCTSGGVKFTSSSGSNWACNGAPGAKGAAGDPWTLGGTLPVGSTETGAWSVFSTTHDPEPAKQFMNTVAVPLSFPIKLAAPLSETNVHFVTQANFTDFDEAGSGTLGCAGTTASPTAPSGHLCVYAQPVVGLFNFEFSEITNPATAAPGAGVAGTSLALFSTRTFPTSLFSQGSGTWAVTG